MLTIQHENKPAVEKEVLFDSETENTIYFEIESKGKSYRVGHIFSPLTDERYFKFSLETAASAKKIVKKESIETEDFLAAENLWNDLCTGRIGYVEKADWKRRVKLFEKIDTIKTLLFADIVETESESSEELLDDDEIITSIRLDAYQNGALISTEHFLGESSRADVDEFILAKGKKPQKGVLASGKIKSYEERLCALYDTLIQNQTGYKNRVPAWHKEKVVEGYFDVVMDVGKSDLALSK
jgi:hypothetical protein